MLKRRPTYYKGVRDLVPFCQSKYIPHFLGYKMHPPQIWEENGGASYSLNGAYLVHLGGMYVLLNILPHFLPQNFFSYFPPVKSRCIVWSKKYGIFFTFF